MDVLLSSFQEDTLTDIDFNNLLNFDVDDSTLVKAEEDERFVSLVDSPSSIGSPTGSDPPSPSLSKSDEPSIRTNLSPGPFVPNDWDKFDFTSAEIYNSENFADVKLLEDSDLANVESSLDNNRVWLSQPVGILEPENVTLPDLLHTGGNELTHIELHSDVPNNSDIPDNELVGLTVKSLNRRLANYPKDVQKELKRRRRTLKNRGYAQNCRTKRVKTHEELQQGNVALINQVNALQKQLVSANGLRRENESMQAELHLLRKEVANLRQENDFLKLNQSAVHQ